MIPILQVIIFCAIFHVAQQQTEKPPKYGIQCFVGFDGPQMTSNYHNCTLDKPLKMFASKITVHVHIEDSFKKLNKDHGAHVLKAIKNATEVYWTAYLSQKYPLHKPTWFSRTCVNREFKIAKKDNKLFTSCTKGCEKVSKCGNVTIPEQYLDNCITGDANALKRSGARGAGAPVGTTGTLLLTYGPCRNKDSYMYIVICQQDALTGKPTLARLNICEGSIKSSISYLRVTYSMRHNIGHFLGFHKAALPYMIDEKFKPRVKRKPESNEPIEKDMWDSKMIIKHKHVWKSKKVAKSEKIVNVLTLPGVKRYVAWHYACKENIGMLLEDNGDTLHQFSHWERRLTGDEIMNPYLDARVRMSFLTLRYFNDSGWYHVLPFWRKPWQHLSLMYNFARGNGCFFLQNGCLEYMERQKEIKGQYWPNCPWLNKGKQYYCSPNRLGFNTCTLDEYNVSAPDAYQYYDKPNWMPRYMELSDYCVFHMTEVHFKEETFRQECTYSFLPKMKKVSKEQFYGPNSQCVDQIKSQITKDGKTTPLDYVWGKGCYRVICDEKAKKNQLSIGTKNFLCNKGDTVSYSATENGANIEIVLVCPDDLCKNALSNKMMKMTFLSFFLFFFIAYMPSF